MRANSPTALLVSLSLHAIVVAMALLFTYAARQHVKDTPKIFELVAGEGDEYEATEAPALGVPGGIKLAIPDIPAPPAATPPEPAPTPPTPAPVAEPTPTPPPVDKAVPKPPAEKPVNFSVNRLVKKRQAALEKKFRKEEAARKAKEDAANKAKMTKEEFDRLNKGKTAGAASSKNLKIARVDAEGISKGVTGGSTANKKGGAGGTALTREEGEVLEAYFSLLRQRLKNALEKPPGLSDTLKAVADVRISADGTLSNARISESSGSTEFDQAVLNAITRTQMPARPDGKSETLSIPFRMRDVVEN